MRILFCILFSLITLPVWAQRQAPKWSDFFEGEPSQLNVDWDCNDCDDPVQPGAPEWDKTGKPLPFRTWIKGYGACQEPLDQMFTLVEHYDQAYTHTHDAADARTTFTQITNLLHDPKLTPECQKAVTRAYWVAVLNMGPPDQRMFTKNDMTFFGLFFANEDLFTNLSPQTRAQMASKGAPIWTKRLASGDYELSGIYSCQDAAVYISDSLLPYNVLGSLAHEMDHLYRDKIGYELIKSWVDNHDVKSFLVTDEILSAMFGAYTQIYYKLLGSDPGYGSLNDFNLFGQNGPLMTISSYFGKMRKPFEFFEFYGFVAQKMNDKGFRDHLCDIDSMVRVGYFNQKGDCNLNNIYPHAAYTSIQNFLANGISQLRRDRREWPKLLELLAEVRDALKQPSEFCSMLSDTESKGELKNYIGTALKGTPSKPANVGVKPCLKIQL